MVEKFLQNLNRNLAFHLLGILAAIALYFIINPHNVGFSPDSMSYLEVAENIRAGNGIVDNEGNIVDHWPPVFPLTLALTSKVSGITVGKAGVLLLPVLLYFTILIFLLILKELRLNRNIILFSGLLLIVSQFTKNYLWYLSEGVFFVLLLLSFLFMLKWLHKKEPKYLIYTGVCCGLLCLSRYAGIGFIGGYILFIIIQNRNSLRKISTNLLFLILPLIITVTPWFLYIHSFIENPEGRQIAVHLVPLSKLFDLVKTFGFWFLGSEVAIGGFLILMIVYLIFLYRTKLFISQIIRQFYLEYLQCIRMCLLLVFIYLAFLMVSISFYDAWTPLDNRILSPILLFVLVIAGAILHTLYARKAIFIFFSTCCFLFLSFASSTLSSFQMHYLLGNGYTKAQWSQSETLVKWKEEKKKLPVYTNGVELGIVHLGMEPILLPLKNRDTEIKNLIKKVKKGEAEIVFFREVNWRNYLVGQEELLKNTKNEDIQQIFLEDGLILRAIE